MLKPLGKAGVDLIRDLVQAIIRRGFIPFDLEDSYIASLYKGKGDALSREKYRRLKLIDQVMKVMKVVEQLVRKQVQIDDIVQFLALQRYDLRHVHCASASKEAPFCMQATVPSLC